MSAVIVAGSLRRARAAFANHLTIGQVYRRRTDGQLAEVVQVHRADRLAELSTDFGRKAIPLESLRTEWDQLVPHDTPTTRSSRP